MNSFAVAGALLVLGSFVVLCVMPVLICLRGNGVGWKPSRRSLRPGQLTQEEAWVMRRSLIDGVRNGSYQGIKPDTLVRDLLAALKSLERASIPERGVTPL